MWVLSLGQEDPWEQEMATHPILLPGKFYKWRRQVSSPWVLRVGHNLVAKQQQQQKNLNLTVLKIFKQQTPANSLVKSPFPYHPREPVVKHSLAH